MLSVSGARPPDEKEAAVFTCMLLGLPGDLFSAESVHRHGGGSYVQLLSLQRREHAFAYALLHTCQCTWTGCSAWTGMSTLSAQSSVVLRPTLWWPCNAASFASVSTLIPHPKGVVPTLAYPTSAPTLAETSTCTCTARRCGKKKSTGGGTVSTMDPSWDGTATGIFGPATQLESSPPRPEVTIAWFADRATLGSIS